MAVCPNCHEQNPELGASCPRCEDYFYIPDDALEEAENDPLIGTQAAGKYVILDLISEGGMGAVYRALQLPVEREVAFKVLRTELKDSDNGRDRFIREARAVSRLNHPNIITLYDFGFEDGRHPYMVMEYAPGKSLAAWLRSERVTLERIFRISAQILSALNEAHQHGIVHRDLKPENMIISPRQNDADRVKLLDFGIARMINEGATKGLTREGEVFGTPDYMAPEQAQGKKSIGPPADIYAVGIMLWEMICGSCPFEAPTPLAVLFMHINDPLPQLRPREGLQVPRGLEQLVLRATSKEPQERYQTAGEMLSELNNLIATSTGMHPGALMGDISHEFVFDGGPPAGRARSGTPAGIQTARTLSSTPVPDRQPHFTPGSGTTPGVNTHDPDPSAVDQPVFQPGEAQFPDTNPPGQQRGTQPPGQPESHSGQSQEVHTPAAGPGTSPPGALEAARRRKKIFMMAAGAVLVLLLGSVGAIVALSSSEEPTEATPETTTTTENTETSDESAEIAATEKNTAEEIEVEPLEPKADEEDPTVSGEADAADSAAATDETAKNVAKEAKEPKETEEAAPAPDPKPRPKRRVQRDSEPKPKPKRKSKPREAEKEDRAEPAPWKPVEREKDEKVKIQRWDR